MTIATRHRAPDLPHFQVEGAPLPSQGEWTYQDASGKDIPLHPGRTWVELVPRGRTVTVQP